MNIGSRLAQDPRRVANDDETTPEERLQRLVLESLRDEYEEEPVNALTVQSLEAGPARTSRWRGLTLFLALVIATTAAGGSLLLILGRQEIEQDTPPSAVATTEPVQPASPAVSQPPPAAAKVEAAAEADATRVQADNAAPGPLEAAPPSSGNLRSLDPMPAKPSVDSPPSPSPPVAPRPANPPRAGDPPRSGPGKPPVAQREAGAEVSPAPARAVAREPELGKPIVWIYYPVGATLVGETARALAARVATDASTVDYMAQADMPRIAVIRFSQGKNQELSKAVAKTLANLGYRWRIEDVSRSASTPHNMVEIWLPNRQDSRASP
jgi:hypothetical protein